MSLDPDVMAARLRSYATSIAADQGVPVERVLDVMREALADMLHHRNCLLCGTDVSVSGSWVEGYDDPQRHPPTAVMVPVAPQDVTNA